NGLAPGRDSGDLRAGLSLAARPSADARAGLGQAAGDDRCDRAARGSEPGEHRAGDRTQAPEAAWGNVLRPGNWRYHGGLELCIRSEEVHGRRCTNVISRSEE